MREFETRSVKTLDAVEGFHLLENSHKLCRGFHHVMKARRTCFISFIKLLFSDLTKRKTIRICTCIYCSYILSWNCKFSQLGDSHSYCSHQFRASLRYENTLVDQSKHTFNPNYFINKNNVQILAEPGIEKKKLWAKIAFKLYFQNSHKNSKRTETTWFSQWKIIHMLWHQNNLLLKISFWKLLIIFLKFPNEFIRLLKVL